jgi:hypothetical protein
MKALSVLLLVLVLLIMSAPGSSRAEKGKARINVFHAVAGAPAVDVQIRPFANETAVPIFTDLQYTEFSDYYHLAAGKYDVIIVTHQDHSKVVMQYAGKEFTGDADYTLVLSGLLTDQEKYPLRILTFEDDNTEPREGKAKLRFIHVAGGFRALDVMLGDMRLWRKVGFGEHSELVSKGYTNVDADQYTMLVTEQDLAFDTTTVDLDEGDVLTVYAVGIRGSLYWGPDLISQITKEADESSGSSLVSWLGRVFQA